MKWVCLIFSDQATQVEDPPFPQPTARRQIPLLERTINTQHQVNPEHRQLRVHDLVSPSCNTPSATLHATILSPHLSKLRQEKENRLVTPSPNKPSVTPQNSNSNPTVKLNDYPTRESNNSVETLDKISGYGHHSPIRLVCILKVEIQPLDGFLSRKKEYTI